MVDGGNCAYTTTKTIKMGGVRKVVTMMRMVVRMRMMMAEGAWWDFRLEKRHHRGCVHQDTFQSTKHIPPLKYISINSN